MKKEIYIIGAGTYGEVMYELAELLDYKVEGFFDEDFSKLNTLCMGTKVIGKFSELNSNEIARKNFIVAIGNNKVREKIMNEISEMGGNTPTLIHPTAILSPSAEIGNGVYIQANTYIWTKVKINDYCIISPNVVIAHHSTIGKGCLVSAMSAVGASINLEARVFVGMGSTIMTGLNYIGEDSIIGAGAVVVKNVEKNSVYAGVPAKKLRDISE
jgi:sugar O-acyltransferase (sialic acid O-acetyltransferase NeuD family)